MTAKERVLRVWPDAKELIVDGEIQIQQDRRLVGLGDTSEEAWEDVPTSGPFSYAEYIYLRGRADGMAEANAALAVTK